MMRIDTIFKMQRSVDVLGKPSEAQRRAFEQRFRHSFPNAAPCEFNSETGMVTRWNWDNPAFIADGDMSWFERTRKSNK
jgi:hypothetical protein